MKVSHYAEIRVKRWLLWPKVKVGFLFDMFAWFKLFDDFGFDLDKIKSDPEKNILFTAAVSAAKEKGKKVWFTPSQIQQFIKKSATEESTVVLSTLKKSQETMQKKMEQAANIKKK